MEIKTGQQTVSAGIFKKIAFCEGISYLLLLGVAMPAKYIFHIPEAVIVTRWIHGLLFILYLISLLNLQLRVKWPIKILFLAGIASILPFGPFIFERRFLN